MSDAVSDTAAARTALLAENAKLVEIVRTADHATEIPTCPGWTLTQLLRHVGRGHRWAATMITDRATEMLDPRAVPGGKPPADLDGTLDWLRESAQAVLDAVDAGPEVPVWALTGPKPARWWIRRRLHEETVHRSDARLALGLEPDLEPGVAADGLSEWLDLVAARREAVPLPGGATLHLHATDGGEWTIRPGEGGSGIVWEPGHAKGDAAVRGPAEALFLAMLRRLPADDPRLEVLGDAAVWRTWRGATPF